MKTFSRLFAALLLSLLAACNGDQVAPLETYCYAETGCADPWERVPNEDEQLTLITSYLEEKGIEVQEISLSPSPDDFIACLACHCPTGRTITVSVPSDQAERLLSLKDFWEEDAWNTCD